MHLQSKLERARVVTYISSDTVKITMHMHANSFGGQIENEAYVAALKFCVNLLVYVCVCVCACSVLRSRFGKGNV